MIKLTDKIQTAIRLQKELWLWVQDYCKKQGLTVTALLTMILIKIKAQEDKKAK